MPNISLLQIIMLTKPTLNSINFPKQIPDYQNTISISNTFQPQQGTNPKRIPHAKKSICKYDLPLLRTDNNHYSKQKQNKQSQIIHNQTLNQQENRPMLSPVMDFIKQANIRQPINQESSLSKYLARSADKNKENEVLQGFLPSGNNKENEEFLGNATFRPKQAPSKLRKPFQFQRIMRETSKKCLKAIESRIDNVGQATHQKRENLRNMAIEVGSQSDKTKYEQILQRVYGTPVRKRSLSSTKLSARKQHHKNTPKSNTRFFTSSSSNKKLPLNIFVEQPQKNRTHKQLYRQRVCR